MEDSKRTHKFLGKPGGDFLVWSIRTKAALAAKKVFHVVLTDVVGAAGENDLSDEQTLGVSEAISIIIQGLGDKPLRLCARTENNPFVMWTKLRERYHVSNVVTKVQLQTRLTKLRYASQIMSDFIDSFEEFFNRLAGMSSEIKEYMQIAMLLVSLGDKVHSQYGQVIASLQTIGETLTWETVSSRLLQEYNERTWPSPNREKAKGPSRSLGLRMGHSRRNRGFNAKISTGSNV